MDPDEAERLVTAAIDRYIGERHDRVDAFIHRNYSVLGSLRLHRRAIGLDLLRAPANVALAIPSLAKRLAASGLAAAGAARLAKRLEAWTLFLDTDVGRELTWRLYTDLLQLPYDDGRRRSDRDALAETIARDPRLIEASDRIDAALARSAADPTLRARLKVQIGVYIESRTPAADLANAALMAGTGAALFKQLTPGALSLGSAIAGTAAQQAAIAAFPLGTAAGALWYGAFAAAPSTALVVASTGGLLGIGAVLTAFAGLVTDPLMTASGFHARRLHRFIDALGTELKGGSGHFRVRDHYVARIFDLFDLARMAGRMAT